MSDKKEIPKGNPVDAPKTNTKRNKNDSVQKPSKLPLFVNTCRPSTLGEPIGRVPKIVAAPKPNKTIAPTVVPNANNKSIGTKKVKTEPKLPATKVAVGKITTDIQKTTKPTDSVKNPMLQCTTSMLNLKPTVNKSVVKSLPTRSKTTLSLPRTEISHTTKFRTKQREQKLLATEKIKVKQFEQTHEKLREIQSLFLERFEYIKDATKIGNCYRLIALIYNDELKLVVKDDDLLRLPRNLPRESVASFKETIKETFNSIVESLENHYVRHKFPEIYSPSDWQNDYDSIREKLKVQIESKFEELLPSIDALCKNSPNIEAEWSRTLKELQESNRKFKEFKIQKENEQSELIAQHKANEIRIHEEASKKVLKEQEKWNLDMATLKEKEQEINSINYENHTLRQAIDNLQKCIIDLKTEKQEAQYNEILFQDQINQCNNERASLVKKINELRNCIKELNDQNVEIQNNNSLLQDKIIQYEKIRSKSCEEIEELNARINEKKRIMENYLSQVQQLQISKHNLNDLQSELKETAKMQHVTPSEISEIHSFKKKLDDTQKELKSIKEQNRNLERELNLRNLKINSLESRNNDFHIKVTNLKFENSDHVKKILQMTNDMENQIYKLNRYNNELLLKTKEMDKLKQGIKIMEEQCETNNNENIKYKKIIADQKEVITQYKKKEKDTNLFEHLTVAEITELNLHSPQCKYSKQD